MRDELACQISGARQGWDGAGAPGGASQGQSPARGAPDAVPRSGAALDPSAGAVPFAKYAADWLEQRQLSPKTAQLYELLLRLHLVPTFGDMSIGDTRQEHVRAWRAAELKAGPQ